MLGWFCGCGIVFDLVIDIGVDEFDVVVFDVVFFGMNEVLVGWYCGWVEVNCSW